MQCLNVVQGKRLLARSVVYRAGAAGTWEELWLAGIGPSSEWHLGSLGPVVLALTVAYVAHGDESDGFSGFPGKQWEWCKQTWVSCKVAVVEEVPKSHCFCGQITFWPPFSSLWPYGLQLSSKRGLYLCCFCDAVLG